MFLTLARCAYPPFLTCNKGMHPQQAPRHSCHQTPSPLTSWSFKSFEAGMLSSCVAVAGISEQWTSLVRMSWAKRSSSGLAASRAAKDSAGYAALQKDYGHSAPAVRRSWRPKVAGGRRLWSPRGVTDPIWTCFHGFWRLFKCVFKGCVRWHLRLRSARLHHVYIYVVLLILRETWQL